MKLFNLLYFYISDIGFLTLDITQMKKMMGSRMLALIYLVVCREGTWQPR